MLRLSRSAVAITLSAIALSLHAPLVAGAPVPPPPRGRTTTLAVEEKKKVPKATAPETKHKGDDPKQDKNDDSDDENGWADCLGSCIGGMFSSSSSSSPKTLTASSAPIAMEWRVGSLGMILPADTLARDVELWDGPGGPGAGHASAGRLRIGSEVVVAEMHALGAGTWLKVTTPEPGGTSGWVAVDDVSARAPTGEAGAGAVLEGTKPAEPPWVPPKSITLLSATGYGCGPQDLTDEYEFGGFMASLTHLWRFGAFASGPSADYGVSNGTPDFDFQTASGIDFPTSSKLQILDFGWRIGQYVRIGSSKMVFHWGLGPTLSLVKQESHMRYVTIDPGDSSVTGFGERDEALSKWRVGGDAAFGLAWRIEHSDLRMGFLVRGFWIPWESEEQKSLTIDFIDHQTIFGINAGVTFGYEWH
jgi:hypothetical protein